MISAMAGSLAGLSLGVAVATTIKSNDNVKTGIIIAITMLGCFLSGMMGITMKYIIDKNTVTILQNKKELIEQGEQYDMPQEYKPKEIIIRNNIRRGDTQKIIEILEKIWIKKEKTQFITNCKSTAKETMIKRELLRMALLRWRFIKGYGGDRYGIIYAIHGTAKERE